MSEPIAGVMPPEVAEAPCKVVSWPTIGGAEAGRWVGRHAATRLGIGAIFTLGNLLA